MARFDAVARAKDVPIHALLGNGHTVRGGLVISICRRKMSRRNQSRCRRIYRL